MSKKHYVVWKGVKTGIFDNWSETKAQIDGRSDAQYMGFASKDEADQAFASTYTRALMKRSF
ncbi:MAG: ribonuclease HI, partial [Moritella dasanensis]